MRNEREKSMFSEFMNTAIQIRQLCFSQGNRPIFKRIDLDIPRYKITAIMGPSGSGKTTLLNLMGGQLKPDSGTIMINNINISRLSHSDLYRLRRRIGVLFQSGALFTDLNVFENVAFPLREHTDLPEDMLRDLVLMQLNAVGLRGAEQLGIEKLSGGMARRVALARATILSPELMFYDEPFTGQDPISRGVLLKLIRQFNDSLGLTSIVVSHDVTETAKIADYMYIIAEGKIMGQGEPKQLLSNGSSIEVRQFTEGLPDGPVAFHYPAKSYEEDLNLC